MKKISTIFICALLIFSLTACTGMSSSDTGSGNMNSGSLSSSLQDAESKISSLLTPSGANVSNSTAVAVTREEAIDKALKHVGLKKEDVKDLEVDLDTEREGVFWEINFDHKDQEFSFDINANTGEIVNSKREQKD